MSKIDNYREHLRTLESWEEYLLQESNLPGPRANLELAFAVASEGAEELLLKYAAIDSTAAPRNSKEEFLAVCGVIGLGYLAARENTAHFSLLRSLASDSRWRIRESVALGLQKYGKTSFDSLLTMMVGWSHGNLLERRAVVATLCEPALLTPRAHVQRVLTLMDSIMASILKEGDRRSEAFRVLRKGLAYGWSVVVAADPEVGKPAMEQWIPSEDSDINWIMKQNLKKKRLVKMDAGWVERQLEILEEG